MYMAATAELVIDEAFSNVAIRVWKGKVSITDIYANINGIL